LPKTVFIDKHSNHQTTKATEAKKTVTFEVSFPLMFSRMFSSHRIVPFNAKPVTVCPLDLADVLDSAKCTIKGQTLAFEEIWTHF
jgi:hypothetical protein